jgi:dUTP pyrophosphatase
MGVTVPLQRLHPDAVAPVQQHPGDAGWDLSALEGSTIAPGGRTLIRTGWAIAIPEGWEGQVRPRSGLALKRGITVLNSPGTIDSGYRGEIGVVLHNTSEEMQVIGAGERIAQLVIAPVAAGLTLQEVEELPPSARGTGGFGHTGA